MSLHALPSIASPAQLFSDFVCSPVAMKGDAHLAIIRDFHGRMKTAEANPASLQQMVAAAASAQAGAEQQWPWEIPLYTVQEGIAFMQISGPLVKGYDDITCWYWRLASTDRISRELAEIDLRGDVHTVILLLKTPGGMAIGIPELGDQLVEMQSRRPVFAFSSDTFASAGYWIAAGCSSIFATKSACVGSIGTYIALYDYTAMLEEWGIKLELFRQGIYKGLGLMGKPLTDEERTFLDDSTGRTNASFTGFVKARRGAVADSTMQGQWFDGEQAAELLLVDRIVTGLPEVLREIIAAKSVES